MKKLFPKIKIREPTQLKVEKEKPPIEKAALLACFCKQRD